MSKISDRDSKMEIFVRKGLFAEGFRYRKNDKSLPGKPDIVLPRYKTVIFTHGCFWHGHNGCKASKLPETKKDFWQKKIDENIQRDEKNVEELKQKGWKVIVIWQCEINNNQKRRERFMLLINEIKAASPPPGRVPQTPQL